MSDENALKIKEEPQVSTSEANIKSESIIPEQVVDQSTNKPLDAKTHDKAQPKPAQSIAQQAPPKRTFVPNLSVDRTKRETKQEELQEKGTKQNKRGPQPNLNAARGRGRGRESNLIQAHSIFEAGPAESLKRFTNKNSVNESYGRPIGSVGASLREDSVKAKLTNKESKNNDDLNVNLQESLLIEDSKEDEAAQTFVKLKYDPKEEDDYDVNNADRTDQFGARDRSLLDHIFMDMDLNKGKLILLQIPDGFQLHEIENEGRIGKIKIRQSGRVDLCIDNHKLNVSSSVAGDFLQDAVVLDISNANQNESTNSNNQAKLTNLGHVTNKVVCVPRF